MATHKQKITVGLAIIGLEIAAIPFALICRSRSMSSPNLAIHLILDMAKQAKFRPQRENAMFADRRAMRPHIEGTVAHQDVTLDAQLQNPIQVVPPAVALADDKITSEKLNDDVLLGQHKGGNGTPEWLKKIPVPVTPEFMHRGQERFNIYCTPCHGYSGYGNGMVQQIAQERMNAPPPDNTDAATYWSPVASYHQQRLIDEPDGQLFNTITNGKNKMAGYASQIPAMDRWAIVAYVRALQRSQNAGAQDVPADHLNDYQK